MDAGSSMQTTTMQTSATMSLVSSEECSLSDSLVAFTDEKTIPFLRRLRDMLKENEKVISFKPGYRSGSKTVLGMIIVHDRITVERQVLPRFFSHSSFASLRRQLNYFSFVRLGKGRQRESIYLNEAVVHLDDILTLKRRSSGSGGPVLSSAMLGPVPTARKHQSVSDRGARPLHRRNKNDSVKRGAPTTDFPSSSSCASVISDDEQPAGPFEQPKVALDLTQSTTDNDVLAGCQALLGLSAHGWLCDE